MHNWGDIYLYPVSTIFRVYGFRGDPYLLPYKVPLKIGIAEVLRQLESLQEVELTNKGRGSIFPAITLAHQFVITKGGWVHFDKFLQPFRLSTAVVRVANPEGFFNDMFRKRVICGGKAHQFHFLEDLIGNEFSLDKHELRKEKWIAFKKAIDFIH